MSNDEKPSWEYPWKPDEIRANNAPWSLAGDKAMSLYLEESSTSFTGHIFQSQNSISSLQTKSAIISSKLDNAFNDFQLLSNTQFLENRIEEEPLESYDKQKTGSLDGDASKPLTKEEKEQLLKETFKKCLLSSLEIYEKAQAVISQADGGVTRDFFNERPSLPQVIGSDAYKASVTAGIIFKEPVKERKPVETAAPLTNGTTAYDEHTSATGDNFDDDDQDLFPPSCNQRGTNLDDSTPLMQDDRETQAQSEFTTSVQSNQSNETVTNETPVVAPRTNQPGTIILSPPNLDTSSEDDEGDDIFVASKSKPSSSFNGPAGRTQSKTVTIDSEAPSTSAVQPNDTIDEGLGFEPPPPVSSTLIDSSDESSDDESIFKPKARVKSTSIVKPALKIENDEPLIPRTSTPPVESSNAISSKKETSIKPKSSVKPDFMSMFDSSDDDEDFLFGRPTTKRTSMFTPQEEPTVTKTEPVGDAISSELGPVSEPSKDPALDLQPDDTKSSEDLTPVIPVDTQFKVPETEAKVSVMVEPEPSPEPPNLEDYNEDELFDAPKPKTVDLSDNSSDDGEGFPNASKAQASKNFASIFNQTASDSDEDLFGGSVKLPKHEGTKTTQDNLKTHEKVSIAEPPLLKTIEADPLLSELPKTAVPKPVESKKDRIFSTDSEDDLFKTLSANKHAAVTVSKGPSKQIRYSEDDDIFTESVEKKRTEKVTDSQSVDDHSKSEPQKSETPKETRAPENNLQLPELPDLTNPMKPKDHSSPNVFSSDEDIFTPSVKSTPAAKMQPVVEPVPSKDVGDEIDDPVKVKKPQGGKVAALGNKLNLGASILRTPGMAPPFVKKPPSQGVSLDQPLASPSSSSATSSNVQSTSTGLTANEIGKDKARLGPRRRPPSRAATAKPGVSETSKSADIAISQPNLGSSAANGDLFSLPIGPSPVDDNDIFADDPMPPKGVTASNGFKKEPSQPTIDIFADSNSNQRDAPRLVLPPIGGSDVESSTKKKEVPDVIDIFDESMQLPNDGSPAKVTSNGKTDSGAKKKKEKGKTAKGKSKKTAPVTSKRDKSRQNDIFDTPDDIFDD